jgi:hypothetical protein
VPCVEPDVLGLFFEVLPALEIRYTSGTVAAMYTSYTFLQPFQANRMNYDLVVILESSWWQADEGFKSWKLVTVMESVAN